MAWLTGAAGWFNLYEGGDAGLALDGLGEQFHFSATGIKKFPSCLCNHVVIDAASTIMREQNLTHEEVRGIDVIISPYMQRIVGAAFDPSGDAQVSGQFSVQYAAACAVYRGGMGLSDIVAERVCDAEFRTKVQAVGVDVESSWPGHVSPGRVTLKTARGSFSRQVEQVPGSSDRPLSDAEIKAKAADCLASAGTADARLIERLFAIGQIANMADFFS